MNRQELFKKYSINETHNEWVEGLDSWISIELFRLMHEGRLPTDKDTSVKYVTDFLDRTDKDIAFVSNLMKQEKPSFGNYYLTAKRMVYMFADQLLTPTH